ncbi:placenta-specific gene 8 protein-like isoform 2-T2 [Lycodopsis pacificus]
MPFQVHCLLPVTKVSQQQMAAQPLVPWKSGLFDCFEEASTCCYGFWCCPCLACTVSGRFGENSCLPLCDIFSTVILAACGIPLFVPPAAVALRAAMRNRYGIKGSICDDIAVSCFCEWCSWCQMHRELKHRQMTPAVVIVQNQNIIQMQPAPVMMAPVYPAQPAFVNYPAVITM